MSLSKKASGSALIQLCLIIFIIIIGETAYAKQNFMVERPKLGLEFSYEFEKDERSGPNINSEDESMTFSERLDIETEGWAYHPALAIFTLRLSPEWEQISEQPEGSDKTDSDKFLQGYFTEVTLLQYKPYTLRLFANRQMSTVESSFAQRSKSESDTYGSTLILKNRILPTLVNYSHIDSRQTGFFDTDNVKDELSLDMRHDKYLGDTNLKAVYSDSSRTTRGVTVNTRSQNAAIQNSYRLTEDKKVTLGSALSYRDEKSDFAERTGYVVSENLLWNHRKNLSTNYTLMYDKSDAGILSSELKGAGFSLTHLLYENLTTAINTSASSNQFTGGELNVYSGGIDLNYIRNIPWGKINVTAGFDYKQTDQNISPDYIQVIDEPVTLTDGTVALLANKNVDIGSIIVTDNGVPPSITYIKDVDYRVTMIDSIVRISRITGGAINNGDTALVSYRYIGNPAFDFSTYGQSYGVNLGLWSVWRIYYNFNRSTQRFLSGIPPDELIDDITHTAGTELEWKWSRTTLEYKDSQTSNTPTESWRMEEAVTLRPNEKIYFNLFGNYGATTFKDTAERELFKGIRANMHMAVSGNSRVTLEGFRNIISGSLEKTTDTGVLSAYEWYYGIWRASASYRFSYEEDDISKETFKNQYVVLKINRSLF
ncbi:MAG: hypothetical protein HY757_03105 [Nitrospirae bacterium]|nr:hypothetical protein [Nitrospirota bacterium]